jgi:ATP/maltotriose-dependent transcriptional regulator MalT
VTALFFESPEVGSAVVSVLACIAVAVSFVLLYSKNELVDRWGIRVLQEPSLGEAVATADLLSDRCAELARTYNLTARELEVLQVLARSASNKEAARLLTIAAGTLKAHTRHIYEKMGIHTRAELDELLGLGR